MPSPGASPIFPPNALFIQPTAPSHLRTTRSAFPSSQITWPILIHIQLFRKFPGGNYFRNVAIL